MRSSYPKGSKYELKCVKILAFMTFKFYDFYCNLFTHKNMEKNVKVIALAM